MQTTTECAGDSKHTETSSSKEEIKNVCKICNVNLIDDNTKFYKQYYNSKSGNKRCYLYPYNKCSKCLSKHRKEKRLRLSDKKKLKLNII